MTEIKSSTGCGLHYGFSIEYKPPAYIAPRTHNSRNKSFPKGHKNNIKMSLSV